MFQESAGEKGIQNIIRSSWMLWRGKMCLSWKHPRGPSRFGVWGATPGTGLLGAVTPAGGCSSCLLSLPIRVGFVRAQLEKQVMMGDIYVSAGWGRLHLCIPASLPPASLHPIIFSSFNPCIPSSHPFIHSLCHFMLLSLHASIPPSIHPSIPSSHPHIPSPPIPSSHPRIPASLHLILSSFHPCIPSLHPCRCDAPGAGGM